MLKNIEVIESSGTELKDNQECFDYLDEVGKSVTIDYKQEEIVFFLSTDNTIVLDFDETIVCKFTDVEVDNLYDQLGYSEIPEYFQTYLDILSMELETEVLLIGEGECRALAIKIYDSYFVAFNILVDCGDSFDPPDPDDGEPILIGSFFYLFLILSFVYNYFKDILNLLFYIFLLMKRTFFLILFFIINIYSVWAYNIDEINFSVKSKNISWIEVKNYLNKYISIVKIDKQLSFLNDFKSALNKNKSSISDNKKDFYVKIEVIIDSLIEDKTVHELKLWTTDWWNDIIAFYRWNINEDFTLFTWNIHGWYEVSTYNSVVLLKNDLVSSEKINWIIIETLNPDWLNKSDWTSNIKWRWNINNVDLNRNFCTENYQNWYYVKWEWSLWKWEYCNSEKEITAFLSLFDKFSISRNLSFHSQWWILFIPDNSIDDKRVIDFGLEVNSYLDYDFDPSFSNDYQRSLMINYYEIDEWGSLLYTGSLDTYIYEKYDIPSILIELESHTEIENKVKDLINILD